MVKLFKLLRINKLANIWVISDTHFMHEGVLRFKNYLGEPMRVFDDVYHMGEHLVERWNSVVKPEDKVFHLGDVALKDKGIEYIGRCNGHKRLLLGNHDYPNMRLYQPYFEKIYSTRLLDKILFSHIPVHPLSLGKALICCHGHTHSNVPPDHFGKQYYNVSCEVLDDYTPIAFEDLKKKAFKRLESR